MYASQQKIHKYAEALKTDERLDRYINTGLQDEPKRICSEAEDSEDEPHAANRSGACESEKV